MNDENNNGQILPPRRSFGQNALWIASIALIYFAAARFSLSLVFQPEGIAAIWPPAGIFLSAILLTRRNVRPYLVGVLFITDLVAEMMAGTPFFVSAIYALALAGDAVLSSWLLLRFVGAPITFQRVRDVFGFLVLAVILSNALMSLVAATMSEFMPGTSFWSSWKWWSASDGIGNLLVTPFLLSWASLTKTGLGTWNPKRVIEGTCLFIPLALLNYVAFHYLSEHGQFSLLLTYLTFPFLLWAALRFGLRGVTLALVVLVAIAIRSTVAGRANSISLRDSQLDAVIVVQLYLVVMAIPSLFLAAVVTERKRAEDVLRESEERFRKVFEEGPIGMVLTGRDFRFLHVNPAFCQMLGYTEEEMRGKTFLDVTDPEHRGIDMENVENLWQGKIPCYRTEKRYIAKNGDIRWGSLSASLMRGRDGKPLYALAMVEDVTERKRAEEAYRMLVDHSLQGLAILQDGRIVFTNQAMAEITGYAVDEMLATPPRRGAGLCASGRSRIGLEPPPRSFGRETCA